MGALVGACCCCWGVGERNIEREGETDMETGAQMNSVNDVGDPVHTHLGHFFFFNPSIMPSLVVFVELPLTAI